MAALLSPASARQLPLLPLSPRPPLPHPPLPHPPLPPGSLPPSSSGDDEPPFYSFSHFARFAQCPLSYRLHYVDRLQADLSPHQHFGAVVHRALEWSLRDHVHCRRSGPLDADYAAEAFRTAWAQSELRDHALFHDGLAMVSRWVSREGPVDAARVLGVELSFSLHFPDFSVRGTMDRVDRTGDDAIRIRDYKTTRLPPSRADAEESLQLAIYNLAARQLWPWARRVEVSLDLLRHDVALSVERTEMQRASTRDYLRATVAQIRSGEDAPRPTTLCAHCDHRSQCPAWSDASAARRDHAGAAPEDLPAVAREREELAVVLKALGERKDALDDVLRAELERAPVLLLEGRRYALNVAMRREYPLEATVALLADAGVPPDEARAKLAAVDGGALKALLAGLRGHKAPAELAALQERLDAQARTSPVTRLTVKEVK